MIIFLLLPLIPTLFSAVNAAAYGGNCPSITCGNITIGYPFYYIPTSYIPTSFCGYLGFGLSCINNDSAEPTTILSLPYNPIYIVKHINYSSNTVTLVDSDSQSKCPRFRQNLTIEIYPLTNRNVNLHFYYNCSDVNELIPAIECLMVNGVRKKSYVFVAGREPEEVDWESVCDENVVTPAMVKESVEIGALVDGYDEVMRLGFVMDWGMKGMESDCAKCEKSGGMCGNVLEKDVCYCLDGSVAAVKCKSMAHSGTQCDKSGYFDCGKLQKVTYPFWTDGQHQANCGSEYKLSNCSEEFPSITFYEQRFLVKNISQENYSMTLSLPNGTFPLLNPCVQNKSPLNVTMNMNLIRPRLVASSTVYILYGCDSLEGLPENARNCECGHSLYHSVYWGRHKDPLHMASSCKMHIEVAVMNGSASLDLLLSSKSNQELWTHLQKAFVDGFEVLFRQPLPLQPIQRKMDLKMKLIIAFSVCGGTALIMLAIFFCYQRRKKTKYAPSSYVTRNVSSDPSSLNDPEKMVALYGLKYFTYDELEEATDSFNDKREIGDGGFGTVYLGKLKDGRTVAVKRLYENNFKRVEQFLNEVEILTRLRHKNLVMLYGCTSRHSRELLLVYEYVSNGTVADHVHGRNAKPGSLPWQTRLKIAVETASALKYLHASDIIHRDVKTNNILLDDNFNVKVADFGLSRLFPLDVTHVSTAPQGTPGYVDPEYHQCYQLTDKSDVYSFGVVLVELISSKPAVDITRHRHEINLSNMAINKIQNGSLHELVDPSLGFDKDCNVHKSITALAELAFQCLQSDKDMRPTMEEVHEILTHIQSGESHLENKAEELDIFSDEFVLLKSGPLPLSPDSVTVKWVSGSVASNSSC